MGKPIGLGVRTAPAWWSAKVPPPKNIAISAAACLAVIGLAKMLILSQPVGSVYKWWVVAVFVCLVARSLTGEPPQDRH